MKKFLVFLISIVTVVSFGLVTYYFLRNDEVINFQTTEIYCNVGDIVTINDLGKSVKKPSNKTKYNYNAGDEAAVSAFKYDTTKGYYLAQTGGEYEVVISTTNKKFAKFKFTVHIGNGSQANPYYIEDEQDLNKIGNTYALDASYVLRSNITLLSSFAPIGFDATTETWSGFAGSFDGANHTIVGTNYTFETDNAGLFYSLNGATVKNLKLDGFKIQGSYSNAGVLAGQANNAVVKNVQINNSSISNNKENGVSAGLIGSVVGNASNISTSAVNEIELSAGDGETTVPVVMAGFVGKLNQGTIAASLATGTIVSANESSTIGGFVAEMVVSKNYGTIQQSYANIACENASFAGFANTVSTSGDMTDANFLKFFIGNYSVNSTAESVNNKPEIIKTLFDEAKGIYGVKGYTTVEDMVTDNSYVYYTINGKKEFWDEYIWKISAGNLPVLINANFNPSSVSSEYFLADTEREFVYDVNAFMDFVNACRTADGKIKNKSYVLAADIDLADIDWQQIDIENSIIDGNGHKISNLNLKNVKDGKLAFFGTVNNSVIKNIVFENPKFTTGATNAAVVANSITSTDSTLGSSNIENIKVEFSADITNKFTSFAAIANEVVDGSTIKDCTIDNLKVTADAAVNYVAAVVNTIGANSRVSSSNINASLNGTVKVAGVANTNDGYVLDTKATINIAHTTDTLIADIAGLVGVNNGEISQAEVELTIDMQKSANSTRVAGVADENNGNISAVTLTGTGITTSDNTSNELYVAGLVCTNNGKLATSKCLIERVGNYNADKRHYVAGLAVYNSGANSTIGQCVVTSSIEGNTVAGAIIKMDNAAAKVDQILIGYYNFSDNTIQQNLIKGDRFVAGVIVDLRKGAVTNVQASSEIYGAKNSTVSSLIVLIFPNGASFKNATIDTALNGYGKFYSECWQDFRNASASVKSELGYNTTGNADRSFDLLDYDISAGSLQSVLINGTTASKNGKSYQTAEFIVEWRPLVAWRASYENTANSSFFKIVNDDDFKLITTYRGSISMSMTNAHIFNWYGKSTITKQCTFDFNSIWAELSNNGIVLQFLNIA